ncbi:MAG: hypothetical protein QNJ29_04990 [Rhizobiaceae bacterium]|nr:hypothetical protein [Rhizobiaceae bacterium]
MSILKILKATTVAVLATTSVASAAQDCFHFDLRPGDSPWRGGEFILAGDQIQMIVEPGPITRPNGSQTQGGPEYRVVPSRCDLAADTVYTQNSNLNFFFNSNAGPITEISVNVCDFGGYENVSGIVKEIKFVGDLPKVDGANLPTPNGSDILVNVVEKPINGGRIAKLKFSGKDIRELAVGGQELFINSICVGTKK